MLMKKRKKKTANIVYMKTCKFCVISAIFKTKFFDLNTNNSQNKALFKGVQSLLDAVMKIFYAN